jgi:DNA-binding transcriptional ArsR family regulator
MNANGDNMDELPEVYQIERVDQMRAMADEMRLRILDALAQEPMTVTQLAEMLGAPKANLHYHVRELERHGLIRLVFTREKSGALEKYFRAVAQAFHISKMLLQGAHLDEALAATAEYLQSAVAGYLRVTARAHRETQQDRGAVAGIFGATLWLTAEELKQLSSDLGEIFRKYDKHRGIEGEREYSSVTLTYDARLANSAPQREVPAPPPPPRPAAPPMSGVLVVPDRPASPPASPSAAPPTLSPALPRAPRRGQRIAMETLHITRRELEQAVARGDQLDIDVVGRCAFAHDIPPELADRAIARFRYRGIVSASPAVREVLRRKEHEQEHEQEHELPD